MKIIDNTTDLLGDNLKVSIKRGSRLRIALVPISAGLGVALEQIPLFVLLFDVAVFGWLGWTVGVDSHQNS